jgi:hypothetical protein
VAYPTPIIEIAFDDGPYVASPTWTDITTYVRSVEITRGRLTDSEVFGSSNANIVLDNRSGIFDPMNTTGTYYGKLLPRRQIRVRATNAATTYDVWRGYLQGWPVAISEAGYDSIVTLSCFDALGLLAQSTTPPNWASYYISSLSPYFYYKFDDAIDPTSSTNTFRDYGSVGANWTQTAGTIWNEDSLSDALAGKSVARSSNFAASRSVRPAAQDTDLGVSVWGTYTDLGTTVLVGGDNGYRWRIAKNNTTGYLHIFLGLGATSWTLQTTYLINNFNENHYAFSWNTTTKTGKVYVNGIEQANTVSSTTFGSTPTDSFVSIDPWTRIQEVAVWQRQLTAAEVLNIYQFSVGKQQETTSARLARLIATTSFPSALTSFTGSPAASVQGITPNATSLTSEAQLVNTSEGGELFVTKAGVLKSLNRTYYQSGTSFTSQATFGGTGNIGIGTKISYYIDADSMSNSLAVNFTNGGTIRSQDTTSISTYGLAETTLETQLANSTTAQSLGDLKVAFGKTPQIVIDPIIVNPEATTANWTTILGLELLDKITVNIVPRAGTTITQPQLIQNINHSIVPGQWTTTIAGSVRYANLFIIGTSLIGGTDLLG